MNKKIFLGTFLPLLVVFFFFDMAVANAETLVMDQSSANTSHASNVTVAGIYQSGNNYWGGATTVDDFGTGTNLVSSFSVLMYNGGGSTCTATGDSNAYAIFCKNLTGSCQYATYGDLSTAHLTTSVSVPSGQSVWVNYTLDTPREIRRLALIDSSSLTGDNGNCGSTYVRYQNTNVHSTTCRVSSGCQSNDFALRVYTADSTPVISNVSTGSSYPRSRVITWDTDITGTTKLKYGLTGSWGTTVDLNEAGPGYGGTSHSITLSHLLTAGTTYHYSVCSTNAAGETCTTDATFATSADSRTSPVVTFSLPTSAYTTGWVTYQAKSEVCVQDYSLTDMTFDFYAEVNAASDCTGSYTIFGNETVNVSAHPYQQAQSACFTGLGYGVGGSPAPTFVGSFPAGCYRMKVRAKVGSGSYGSYSSTATFTVATSPVGGGGGGSWSGGGATAAPGASEWTTALDAVASHDTTYGACRFFPDIWTTAAAGDGLPCLWSWIKYGIFPPENVDVIDFLSLPMQTLAGRWPFVYFTSFVGAWSAAISGNGSCPLPSFFTASDDYGGVNIPSFDICTSLDQVAGVIEDNATAVTYLQVVLWITLVGFSVRAFKDFFSQ